jgi:hypothetical protein
MYKYSLNDPGEEDLLTPPEGTLDARGRPSPLTGDMLNLNALEEPALPPAPEPAPIGEGTGSYLDDAKKANPAMFSPHFTTAQWDEALANQRAANTDVASMGESAQSRLESAAPEWYKGGEPPKGHSGWATAANVLGGALAAPAAQRLKDPNRLAGLKQKDARQVALASGMSTLFSSLFNQGKENYDAKQAAALKEAQMMRTIPGGKSTAQIRREGADKTVEQMQRDAMQGDLAANRAFLQGQTTAELDPNDPQAVALRATLEASGVPHDELKDLGRKALQMRMGVTNTNVQAGHTAGQKAADAANTERDVILKADVARNEKFTDAIDKEKQRRGESAVPGINWRNNTPPDPKTVDEARLLYKDSAGFIDRIDRMRTIQPRIIEIARKYAREHGMGDDVGKALAAMGPVLQWTEALGPEAHALANEAAVLQTSIQNFIRSKDYSNLGVMQKWEDLKTKLMIPMAGSPTALLRGPATWDALRNDVDQMWRTGVRSYGGFLDGEQDPGAAAGAATPEQRAADRPSRPLPPRQAYNPKTRQVEDLPDENLPPVPTDSTGGLGTTGATPQKVPGAQPAPAPAPKLEAGQKMYKVKLKDGTTQNQPMEPAIAARFAADHPDVIASVEEI